MKVGDKLTKCRNTPLFITSVARSSFRHIHFGTTFTLFSHGLVTFTFPISLPAFSSDSSGWGVIQYLKYDTVSKGSYTPGAARFCVNDSFKFSILFQNIQLYIYNKLFMVSKIKGNIPLTIPSPT